MRKLFFSFMLALLVPMVAGAQEPYAVLSDDNTVLTFYYDEFKDERNGMDVGPFAFNYVSPRQDIGSGWDEQRESITSVVFDTSFANCTTLTSTANWFFGFNNLTAITGISNLNTANVTDMGYMFYCCSALTSLDVSRFNTANVTNMRYMFYGCSGLTSLDVSRFNTANVTNMRHMFYGCSGLTSLDVSRFNTANVTNMEYMFYDCSGLTSLDIRNFKTDNVTNMRWMFYGCSGLTGLDVNYIKTNNVTDMSSMFDGCSGLTSLDVSNFKTDKVKSMNSMFSCCSALKSLDLSGFSMANVTEMYGMFWVCSSLTTIYCEDDWYAKGYSSGKLFSGCNSLVGGAGTVFKEAKADVSMAHPDSEDNPGYFTRKETLPDGDVDGDGKTDSEDVVSLMNYISGMTAGISKDAADVNKDGKVDVADVVALVNIILE